MSDDNSNSPFGSAQLKPLQWVPPVRKPPTEAQRLATEQHLQSLNVLGQMIGASFDVTEAMHERGMKTLDEVAAEQAAAEAAKAAADAKAAQAKTWAENDRRERQEQAQADDQRLGEDLAVSLSKKIAKTVKRAVKATLKSG